MSLIAQNSGNRFTRLRLLTQRLSYNRRHKEIRSTRLSIRETSASCSLLARTCCLLQIFSGFLDHRESRFVEILLLGCFGGMLVLMS